MTITPDFLVVYPSFYTFSVYIAIFSYNVPFFLDILKRVYFYIPSSGGALWLYSLRFISFSKALLASLVKSYVQSDMKSSGENMSLSNT